MPRALLVRIARVDERQMLEDLQRRTALVGPYREQLAAHPEAIVLPAEHLQGGGTYVAEHDGTVLGFYVLLPRSADTAELDGLFVEPTHWRQGIGKCLVQHAETLAKARGAHSLYVSASPAA